MAKIILMIVPDRLQNKSEWVFVGPMGPQISPELSAFPVIAVDGGAHFTERMDIWVGDSDSRKNEITAPDIFKLPQEKDESDLACAFALFKTPQHYKFHLWGFLGGRRDHELFNLGEGLSFLEEHHECQMLLYNEKGKLTFHLLGAGQWKFSHKGLFSLGTLKKTLVKLTGNIKYPIKTMSTLRALSSFGLSNEGSGDILLETEGPVFLYYPEGT